MNSRDIRQSFIDFFVARGHRHVASSPLVPHGDPTLLFTNAGMVQFKDYFLGAQQPPSLRAVTSQKCLRVSGKHNDLENVGPSPRHHTFFEMLGNFSFGDYFKAEAIEFAWELVTGVWGLPAEHLFATVYHEDDDAFDLWRKLSTLPESRIHRCGHEDNFWAMGDTGPCGPCSEIFIDRSPLLPEVGWSEGTDSGRYLEIWNLVFMQYERSPSGTLEPLPKPSIDTGSGLERVAAALQGKESNYDTDLFSPILLAAASRAKRRYGDDPQADVSLRVIADHLRAVGFLLADGVVPGNEGRGYVLRRILRRAVRHGMKLGLEEPFLAGLLPSLGGILGDTYPELGSTRKASTETIEAEEQKYLETVASGSNRVQVAVEAAKAQGSRELDGATAFRLYDTYGLPVETIREIVEEEKFGVDEQGFAAALEEQRRRSRLATAGLQAQLSAVRAAMVSSGEVERTRFEGYESLELEDARIHGLLLLEDGGARLVDRLKQGASGVAWFDRTVMYAESGGQIADQGEILGRNGARAWVHEVQNESGRSLHFLRVENGELGCDELVEMRVSQSVRRDTERHHTATHLLHAALREVLGDSVRQAGSLVQPERLRFDFTIGRPIEDDERIRIEGLVNGWVRQARGVEIVERPYDEALSGGAMALFGEKYGDVVRTVSVPGFSYELCGGCHVRNTGEIGAFVITSERGVASGVRRIEALAGSAADAWYRARDQQLGAVEEALGVAWQQVAGEIVAVQKEKRRLEKEVASLRMKLMSGDTEGEESQELVAGVAVLAKEVPTAPANELRNLADVLRGRLGSGVVVLGTRHEGKASFVTAVSADLKGKVHAGRIARSIGDAMGGSGGGRDDFAQAGGKDAEGIGVAFAAARRAVAEQLGGAK